MMLLKLAFRNLLRHPRQTLTLGFVVAVGIALLFTGNSLLDGTDAGIEESFVASFTGHLSVRAVSDVEFGVFGDQTPVIGELFKMPVLPMHEEILAAVKALPEVESATSIVSGLVYMEIGAYRMPAPVFGVDPETYFRTFPGVRLDEGRYVGSGEKGVILTRGRAEEIERILGEPPRLGSDVQFSVVDGNTFRIRSAPLVGIIEYPVRNETLDSIVLTDPSTLRELYDYLILQDGPDGGQGRLLAADAEAEKPMDLDAIFSEAPEDVETPEEGVRREEIEEELVRALSEKRPVVNAGAWNFIIARLEDGGKFPVAKPALDLVIRERGWNAAVLDWRKTAGASALFIYWMRVIFNSGFFVVAFATLIILVDSLIIGVLERVPEIGTMRALGATKGFIHRAFLAETSILTTLAGVVGITAGTAVSLYMKYYPFVLENPFLIQLFGANALVPRLSLYRVFVSLATSVVLGTVGWIYPVRLALKVQPKSAMQRNV